MSEISLLDLADLALLREQIESTDILSNATRVGMVAEENGCLIPDPRWHWFCAQPGGTRCSGQGKENRFAGG